LNQIIKSRIGNDAPAAVFILNFASNVIDGEMHRMGICTTRPKNTWAVLPIRELLVKISYVEAYNQDISPDELKFDGVVDESVRINPTNFYEFLL
jgi:hypothetical protein